MIEIRDLNVIYRSNSRRVHAVRNANLTIEKGRITALVGESGSGKSTLLMAVTKLLPPGVRMDGSVFFENRDLLSMTDSELASYRWKKIALILQGSMNSLTPVIRIGSQIEEVLAFHLSMNGSFLKQRTGELLNEAGLDPKFSMRFPHELSGGQKQRAAIAMALACDPPFLLADEPTTALDVITQSEIIGMLQRVVRSRNMGMLLVTHDIALASSLGDEIAVMKDGQIVEKGDPTRIITSPEHDHTRELISALQKIEGGTEHE
ncbi:MAG: ABC transporter ATP-binding protein [Synergistales bacterium]|nr:ABC transporter ATP-binding protein [Synergistales bacterium]